MTHPNPNPNRRRRGRRGGNRNPNAAGGAVGPQHGPQAPMTSLAQRCQRHFPVRARVLGHGYFVGGRVSEPNKTGETFTLAVRGSGPDYSVVLDFSKLPATKSMEARCDCPYYDGGGLCKHLWAAVLQIDKAGLNTAVPESGPIRVLHIKPRARRDQRTDQPVKLPGALPTPMSLPTPNAPINSNWVARLDKIQGAANGTKSVTAFAGTSAAFFVINAAETIASGKLVLDLWIRDRLPNGKLGPLRPNQLPSNNFFRFTDVQDQEVLSVLTKTCTPQTFAPFGRGNPCSRFTVDPILETHLMPLLASAGKLFLSRAPNGSPDDADRPLKMDRSSWVLELKVETVNPAFYRLGGILKRDTETRNLNEPLWIFNSSFLLFADRISRLADPRQVAWATSLRSPEPVLISKEDGDALLKRILTDSAVPKITWPEDMGWSRTVIEPTPRGVFRPLGNTSITGRMTLTVSFDYAGREVSLDDRQETFTDVEQKRVYSRNLPFEEQTLTQALKILRDDQGTGTLPTNDLHRVATDLSNNGWIVYVENQRLHVADDFAMNVSSDTDWFDLKMEASFGKGAVGQPELLAALEAKDGFVKLSDGSLGMLPQDFLSRYASISQFGEKTEDGALRFNRSQGLMLNAALGESDRLKGDSGFTAFQKRVEKFEGVKTAKAPKGFNGKLRNYQKEGLAWLDFVEEFEMGGVLADDMGLGKTIQILAFLQGRKKTDSRPSIVIAPKSLIFNWLDEASRFVPDLKVISYVGTGRTKQLKDIPNVDLVVTTYGTLRTDVDKLQEFDFEVAIADEAQAIKNPASQSSVALKKLKARHHLALTGTPVENSLTDLFSILEFTSPGLLSTITNQKEYNEDTRKILASMLRPFILRRTKEKVLKELPEKSEQVLYCEMSTTERERYNALRDHYRASLAGEIETNGLGKSKIHVLEALLRLRQASCHPGLVNPEKKTEPSAKLRLLLNQIQEVIQEGHKALVFSQFTSLLDLVRTDFDQAGITYEYLDGQTVDRKKPVERFQSDPKCPVFLISLKAGGSGLNLTAADYVFILDPWWNPAVEAQAIGRAHRIGQSQKVFAYRMIARGTVEEKILELQKTKRELAESIFSGDKDFMRKLTKEDLELLLT